LEYKEVIDNLERFHILRKLFFQRTFADSKLHSGQIAIMNYIYDNEGCTQADLADFLKVSAASIATSTKRLQKSDMITKKIDDDNLRCKHLFVTEKGRREVEENRRRYDEYYSKIFSSFTDDEIFNVNQSLLKLIDKMSEAEGIPVENDVLSIVFKKIYENSQNECFDSEKI